MSLLKRLKQRLRFRSKSHKSQEQEHEASQTTTKPVLYSQKSISAQEQNLDRLDLAMALLIGGTISLFTTFLTIVCLRSCSYYIFLPPYHNNSKLSLSESLYYFIQDVVAINFSDPRFDFAFAIGLIPGTIIGAWNGRSILRTLAKGKGIIDWLVGDR